MQNEPLLQREKRLRIEYLPITSLTPMPGAPREHPRSQIKFLEKSIQNLKFNVPVLVDRHNRLIAGHARVQAAKNLGLTEVPAIRIEDLNEAQIKALMLADNRIGELAKWNAKALGTILLELSEIKLDFDPESTGFYLAEYELKIVAGQDIAGENEHEEEQILVGAGPAKTQIGDLWRLGSHILLCGDAREAQSWRLLMGDERAGLVASDPPYNVPISVSDRKRS